MLKEKENLQIIAHEQAEMTQKFRDENEDLHIRMKSLKKIQGRREEKEG